MTTNQTIDGVPRKLLSSLLAWLERANERNDDGDIAEYVELRALLDAPAAPKPTGLSQGWNLTRKHDGFVVGHQSVAYPPDETAILRAERDGYVWVPFLVPAAQPQGEPVAWMNVATGQVTTCAVVVMDWDDEKEQVQSLYAEQPAPVALLAEAREWLGDGKHADGMAREHWTPEYAALIDRIDATLRK